MKKLLFLAFAASSLPLFAQKTYTEDVDRFWKVYDLVKKEPDSAKKVALIQTEYIDKGTQGLHDIIAARNYSAPKYVSVIGKYPKFWTSIRPRTLKAKQQAKNFDKGIAALKKIYPEAKPVNVYFTVGLLRANGTVRNGNLLIGTESALADKDVDLSDIAKAYPQLPVYFSGNPINNFSTLMAHEYVHTQQKSTVGNDLLTQVVMEGLAEFVSCLALNTKSTVPAMAYGKAHADEVRDLFSQEMFTPFINNASNWIWNTPDNRFGVGDMGYYVGNEIARKYYEKQKDKKAAIKHMIELDYNNADILHQFVDESGYFEKKVKDYIPIYEANRPTVKGIVGFANGSTKVDPNTKIITLQFSEPMMAFTNFELGPLGKEGLLTIEKVLGWSQDKKELKLQLKGLEPNRHYQIVAFEGFRSQKALPLQPYLIDFTTAAK